jgi:uncharacterized protein (DUF1330 family)
MTPEFLHVQIGGGTVDADDLARCAAAVRRAGGTVLAARPRAQVETLEPGTPAAALLLATWSSRAAFDAAWDASLGHETDRLALGDPEAVVLAVRGLPAEGLPDRPEIPTVASVPRAPLATPPTFMCVQGSVTDAVAIGAYRDVILPMLKQLGAFYVAFAIAEGDVRVLRGSWSEQIYAISEWPTHEAAHAFWYSDRYQNVAVPIRTGIGSFHVHLLAGA